MNGAPELEPEQPRPALVAITRRGAAHAARLAQRWPEAQLFVLEPWVAEAGPGAQLLKSPLRDHVPGLLAGHAPVCFFCALGAVVRLIAPHLRSKRTDPAVLAVDEMARFVIPVISGHLGGANAYALQVAGMLRAQPVITTASDSAGTLAVDLLGRELDWRIEAGPVALTRAAAKVVNGRPVAIVQECGDRGWRDAFPSLPDNLALLDDIGQADPARHEALLWITHAPDTTAIARRWPEALVVYRPPRGQAAPLAVGLGCDRGTPLATVEAALEQALAGHHLDSGQIRVLATIDKKGDEAAILALMERLKLPLILFSAARLDGVAVPNPSATVRRHVGTGSVAEAAALLAAGAESAVDHLLVEKVRHRGADGKNATVAIAIVITGADGRSTGR